ncbi:hypothetical protein HPB52_009508 [Rhipicephalus sanguineus]|uniref:Store-operated calcium entry-associated regulatory factor n=1 Tax=Rhipicephalus sanguineus TaxID=34632 RepID=A0A9D4PDQ5_RHISA|nr:hypothetical protein HPB52_009508 [Rhipicephalus sanguineus]
MRCTVANAVLLCILVNLSDCLSGDKVKLADVEFLTFRQGLYTTGRRSHSSVPQLNCRGGSAGCQDQPSVVQCYNRGTDGTDVQRECKAEMNKSQKFDMIQVKCEGYDNPQDEYILKGSCSLEYQLMKTGCDSCPKDGAGVVLEDKEGNQKPFSTAVSKCAETQTYGMTDAGEKVKLSDVRVLNLSEGRNTTGRRYFPVPQLMCCGGTAGCKDKPTVVRCYNIGSDGRDVQLEYYLDRKGSPTPGPVASDDPAQAFLGRTGHLDRGCTRPSVSKLENLS